MKTNIGCGCTLLLLLVPLNLILGTMAANYCVLSLFNKTIPTITALFIGLVAGEVTMPLAIVLYILRACGIHTSLV